MKKILLLIFVLTLCGCSSTAKVKPVTRGLTFTAEITYYNEYYECDVEINQTDQMKISLTYPEDLNGLVFTQKNNKIITEFKGIKCETVDSYSQTAINYIFKAFENETQKAYKNGEKLYTKGSLGDGEYTMYITEAGLPLKICDSLQRFEITIKNLTLHKEKQP